MRYVGDYSVGSIVYFVLNTFDSNDPAASVTITNLLNTDIHIHKDDGLVQRNNAAGVTVSIDFDGITGNHMVKIDTSDNTVADFWVGGADYFVRMEGTTIDAATVNAWIGHFSLENRRVAGELISTTIATLASQTSFTLTAGSADNSAYNNCIAIVSDQISAVQKCIGTISAYTGVSKTVTLAADPAIFTIAAKDNITIIATSALANVKTVNGTLQTANDNGLDINAILVDTNELQADWTDAGRLDLLIDAIKAVTDALPNSGALTDIDTGVNNLETRLTALRGGYLDELAAANIPADVDTLLTRVTAAVATAAALATAQNDLDLLTGADGVTLATVQGNYAPNVVVPDVAGTAPTAAEINTEVDNALNTAIPGAPTANSINQYIQQLKWVMVNKMAITEASGNTDGYKDDDATSAYSIAAAFTTAAGITTRKRLET